MKILIIENDTGMQDALQTLLVVAGYQVITAGRATHGLGLAIAQQPAAICCDLMLNPLFTGLDFLREKQHIPAIATIPVIMITAAVPELLRRAYEYGAYAHLSKPFSRKELYTLLHRALENHR
jgi:CheY-like chemotaxis protein